MAGNKIKNIYWKEIVSHSILAREYFKVNVKTLLEYKGSFVIQLGTMFFNDVMWIFFWWLFFARFPQINGWGFNDLLLLWAIGTISYGIVGVFFANRQNIPDIVYNGKLDYYLTLPKNVLLHLLISRTSAYSAGDILFGLFVAVIALPLTQVPLFILFTITGVMLFISLGIITGVLAFWMGNSERLSRTLWNGITAISIYPTSIFDNYTKLILFTIIPAGLISGLPVEILKNYSLNATLLVIGITLITTVTAIILFYKGLKKYESGNQLYVNS